MELAREMKIKTFGFGGTNGGKVLELCDGVFLVRSKVTGSIQGCHITADHTFIEYIED